MASTTPNIGLTLPTGAEKVSRQIINANNTIIDSKMGAVPGGQNLQGEIDALNGNLGSPSSASSVTGADAFSKINTLNSKIDTITTYSTTPVVCGKYNNADVYRKYVTDTITGEGTIALGVDQSKIVKIEALRKYSNRFMVAPYYNGANDYYNWYMDGSDFKIRTSATTVQANYLIIIEYIL